MSQRGILDDPLFIRIYSLLAGLLILGVVGMCLLLIFAQTYSWLAFLGYVVLGGLCYICHFSSVARIILF